MEKRFRGSDIGVSYKTIKGIVKEMTKLYSNHRSECKWLAPRSTRIDSSSPCGHKKDNVQNIYKWMVFSLFSQLEKKKVKFESYPRFTLAAGTLKPTSCYRGTP